MDWAIILFALFSHIDGQTVPPTGTSILSTTDPTCGVGNISCSTYEPTSVVGLQTTASSPASPEANTVSPAENVTNSEIELTTQSQMKISTSTKAPPTASPVAHQPLQEPALGYDNSGVCACDLKFLSCDVNCCCDTECSTFQRISFSHCQVEGYPPYDNRYCYASKLVFLNNSEHILKQTQNGAFCIVHSNLAGSVDYPSHSAIINHQEFSKHWSRTHSSIWPEPSPEVILSTDKPKPYKAGSPLWILQNKQIVSLELPVSGLTTSCTVMQRVSYLLPWSSKCIRKVPTNIDDCENISIDFIQQIKGIIQSPQVINPTEITERKNVSCPEQICVPIKYFTCSGSSLEKHSTNRCTNNSIESMFFGYKSGICHGVMKKLNLIIYHNGTAGLKYAEAYLWLMDILVTKELSTQSLHQSFSVEYNWITHNDTTETNNTVSHTNNLTFSRSGNRGYVVGKPIIAGIKLISSANKSEDSTKESRSAIKYSTIQLSPDPNQWITLPKPDLQGMCDWTANQRHIVTFGEDLHMSCGVVISLQNISTQSSCTELRKRMLHLFLGDFSQSFQNGSTLSDWRRMIAMFGNANVSNPEEWIPFLLDGQTPFLTLSIDDQKQDTGDGSLKTCESVPLGIQISIMHSFVGTTQNPQSKIFGASLKLTSLQDVGLTCSSLTCFRGRKSLYLRIVSTVKFVDMSSPSVTRFAEPPAIHIRLPPDFFYPFLSTENSSPSNIHNIPLLLSALSFVFVEYL